MNWPISWKLRNLMDLVCIPSFIPLIKNGTSPVDHLMSSWKLIHEAAFSRGWMKMKAKFPWCCIKFNLISSKDDWLNNKDTPGLFMCIGYGFIWWNLALSIPIPSVWSFAQWPSKLNMTWIYLEDVYHSGVFKWIIIANKGGRYSSFRSNLLSYFTPK